jgi:hypothetical protein
MRPSDLADPHPAGSLGNLAIGIAGAWRAARRFFGGVETAALLVLVPMASVRVEAVIVGVTGVLHLWIVFG